MEVVKAVCCGRFGFGSCKDTSVGACFVRARLCWCMNSARAQFFKFLAIECSVKGLLLLFECCAREL